MCQGAQGSVYGKERGERPRGCGCHGKVMLMLYKMSPTRKDVSSLMELVHSRESAYLVLHRKRNQLAVLAAERSEDRVSDLSRHQDTNASASFNISDTLPCAYSDRISYPRNLVGYYYS